MAALPRPLVLAVALVLALADLAHAQSPPVQGWGDAKFAPLAERIRASDSRVSLLEGLPHQLVEHSSYLHERERTGTIEIGGYHFYKAPLPLSPAQVATLRAAALDSRSYRPYGGPKRCGGFHPDFALRWGDGRTAVYTLICFGCHETQTVDRKTCVLADLPDDAFGRFQTVLERLHGQRPAFRRG